MLEEEPLIDGSANLLGSPLRVTLFERRLFELARGPVQAHRSVEALPGRHASEYVRLTEVVLHDSPYHEAPARVAPASVGRNRI